MATSATIKYLSKLGNQSEKRESGTQTAGETVVFCIKSAKV